LILFVCNIEKKEEEEVQTIFRDELIALGLSIYNLYKLWKKKQKTFHTFHNNFLTWISLNSQCRRNNAASFSSIFLSPSSLKNILDALKYGPPNTSIYN